MENSTNRKNIPELNEPKNILGKGSAFFINRYRVVYLIIAAIIIIGVSSYYSLPRELNPEVTLPFGHILTIYNGAAPEEVEYLVTDKIEAEVSDISDIKEISSSSGFGYSSVFIEFEQGVEIKEKLDEIREKMSSVQNELPGDSETPVVSDFETGNAPIMIINISANMDFVELKNVAEDISERLEQNNNIKESLVIGGLEREISIIVDPQVLYNYGISLNDINNALAASNINFPGGDITLDKKIYNLRTVGQFADISEVENTIIKYTGNSPVYLRDIAKVADGYKEVESYSRMSKDIASVNAKMLPSVSISVKKKVSSDIIKTAVQVKDILNEGRGTLYPEDLNIVISGDTSTYVEDQLGGVTDNAFSGLFIVLIVLFLFIGFSEAVIVSTVIPLALLVTMFLLKQFGMTINTITLFSMVLAVGMLVDNGIVIMENIDRLRFKGLTAREASEVGTNQIGPAVFSSMLTTVSAFFPIVLTGGIMGAFIRDIPLTVIFALVSSFLIAMTITPSLCSIILKKHRSEKKDLSGITEITRKILAVIFICVLSLMAFQNDGRFGVLSVGAAVIFGTMMAVKQFKDISSMEKSSFIQKYSEILYSIIISRKKRFIAIMLTAVAFAVSLSMLVTGVLKVEMFPSEDYDRLYVDVNTPNGTTIDITDGIIIQIEDMLLQMSEIDSFVSNVGITGADSFDEFSVGSGSNPRIGRIVIDLVDKKFRDKSSMDLADELREKVKNIPGGNITVMELESGPPQDNPVVIRLKGSNLEKMKKTTEELELILSEIQGTREVSSSVSKGDYELQVKINKTEASKYGVNDLMIASAVRNATQGIKATSIKKNQKDIDIVIRTSEESFKSKSDIEDIYIYSPSGGIVKLSAVAEVVPVEGLTTINHEGLKRVMSISAGVHQGYNSTELLSQFREKIKDYNLDKDILISYGGEFEDIQETFTEMFINMIVAAILVYIILSVQFNSLSQPMIILFTVPMALIGVVSGLLLTGNDFGFVAFVGIVALVGIAVNDAIVLVDYINYLRKNGHELYDAVKETGVTRFIPVLATTITTAGGILPLSMKEKFFQPLGVTIIFGLSMATILTLIIIPTLYTSLEERKIRKAEKKLLKGAK